MRNATGAQVIYDGPNVFVGVDLHPFGTTPESLGAHLKAFGLNALYSQLYFRKSKNGRGTLIRVPVVMDRPDLEKTVLRLNEKLEIIASMVALQDALPVAP